MIVDPGNLSGKDAYKLLIGSVVPRPIAWISTVGADGINNLAPFSFYTVASRNPPTLCISIGERSDDLGPVKDSLKNIRDTESFVVNVVSVSLANAMHESSGGHPPEADEFEAAGLSAVSSGAVEAPRVGEALISMECRLDRIIPVGEDHLVLGTVVLFHIRDDL